MTREIFFRIFFFLSSIAYSYGQLNSAALSILIQGAREEEAIFKDNLINNDQTAFGRMKSPLSVWCKWKTYPNLYYFGSGSLITVLHQIKTRKSCAKACRNYKSDFRKCRSANYLSSTQTCELMETVLNFYDRYALENEVENNPDSNWILPLGCSQMTEYPVAPQANIPKCGHTYFEPFFPQTAYLGGRRIVGGIQSRPHSLPWTVSLQRTNYGTMQHFCGGALIRVTDADESDIVLSAAHCFYSVPPQDLRVMAGIHSLSLEEGGQQEANGVLWKYPDDYNNKLTVNDVVVIKLDKPIKFSQTVQPVCLPEPDDQLIEGMHGLVAGWGSTKYGGTAHETLMQALVVILNISRCMYNYEHAENPQDVSQIIPEFMICAGYFDGRRDTCQGDSGGPLVVKYDRGYVLQGLVSFGPNGCALHNLPGIYTRLSHYVQWIKDTARSMSSLVPGNTANQDSISTAALDTGAQASPLGYQTQPQLQLVPYVPQVPPVPQLVPVVPQSVPYVLPVPQSGPPVSPVPQLVSPVPQVETLVPVPQVLPAVPESVPPTVTLFPPPQ